MQEYKNLKHHKFFDAPVQGSLSIDASFLEKGVLEILQAVQSTRNCGHSQAVCKSCLQVGFRYGALLLYAAFIVNNHHV